LAIAGWAQPLQAQPPQQLRITVTDDKSCIVEGKTILCVDLLKHLREVVKLPAGSIVRVRVEDTASTATDEVTLKVFELLLNSEYKTPIGFVDVSKLPDR
jgi:hypothetical protein